MVVDPPVCEYCLGVVYLWHYREATNICRRCIAPEHYARNWLLIDEPTAISLEGMLEWAGVFKHGVGFEVAVEARQAIEFLTRREQNMYARAHSRWVRAHSGWVTTTWTSAKMELTGASTHLPVYRRVIE